MDMISIITFMHELMITLPCTKENIDLMDQVNDLILQTETESFLWHNKILLREYVLTKEQGNSYLLSMSIDLDSSDKKPAVFIEQPKCDNPMQINHAIPKNPKTLMDYRNAAIALCVCNENYMSGKWPST